MAKTLADAIYCAMKIGVYYRPCDIALLGRNPSNSEKRKILDMLVKAGLVECIDDDGYRRKKLYKTKQKSLL